MIASHYKPQPPLSDFIDQFWFWDGYIQPHAKERMLPDGSMTLVFNLREDRIGLFGSDNPASHESRRGQVISGARSSSFIVDTRNMVSTIGVQFKAGGAFPFLGMPADELAQQCVSLDDVFGSTVREVRECLLATPAPKRKFQILEQWLLRRVAEPLQRHPAVQFALSQFERDPASTTVASVVDRVGFSQRHFIELFTAEVGLTPKLFSRVRRFHRVVQTIALRREIDWADTALCCGYYDQAHFVHDFKQFSALTPETYLLYRTPHLNHVPLAA